MHEPGTVRKSARRYMIVLSPARASRGYLVTIGDPRSPQAKTIRGFHGDGAAKQLAKYVEDVLLKRMHEDYVMDATGLGLVSDLYSADFPETVDMDMNWSAMLGELRAAAKTAERPRVIRSMAELRALGLLK